MAMQLYLQNIMVGNSSNILLKLFLFNVFSHLLFHLFFLVIANYCVKLCVSFVDVFFFFFFFFS